MLITSDTGRECQIIEKENKMQLDTADFAPSPVPSLSNWMKSNILDSGPFAPLCENMTKPEVRNITYCNAI